MADIVEEVKNVVKKNVKIDLGVVLLIVGAVWWASHKNDEIAAQASEVEELKRSQIEYNDTVKKMDRRLLRLELMNAAMTKKFNVKWEGSDNDSE
jgi:hypothetical protein